VKISKSIPEYILVHLYTRGDNGKFWQLCERNKALYHYQVERAVDPDEPITCFRCMEEKSMRYWYNLNYHPGRRRPSE
jgi:hypothetical protein